MSGYVQITDDGQGKGLFEGALVTDGSRIYFGEGSGMAAAIAPNDSPVVLHDTGTQEIYALDWHEP